MLRLALVLAVGITPHALATKLLKTPIRAAELPRGFTRPRLEKQPPSAKSRTYHAVGLVDAALKGPNAEDAIAWIVFPSHEDAVGDLDHPALGNGVRVIDTVPGLHDSLVLTDAVNGTTITDATAVVDNVLVQGVVASSTVRKPTAIVLLEAAIAHLQRIR